MCRPARRWFTAERGTEITLSTVERLRQIAGTRVVSESVAANGQVVLVLDRSAVVDAARALRDELGFPVLLDIAGLDLSGYEKSGPRFGADYLFLNPSKPERVRFSVRVTESDPVIPTLTRLYKSANWLEREVFDQFGIRFEGHPDLRRILNHTEFVGHPLRKDYPVDGRIPLSRADTLDVD